MKKLSMVLIFLCVTTLNYAATFDVILISTSSIQPIGKISFEDTPHGLLITPTLHNITPGVHGFHLHAKPDCSDAGKAAGDHFDPQHTKQHLGPYNDQGHLGDLPALIATHDGSVITPVLAPRFKIKDLDNHALILHEGGDNYSDKPQALGGGGTRMACAAVHLNKTS